MDNKPVFKVVEWAIEHGGDMAYITVEASYENFRCTFEIPIHKDDCGKFLAAGDALKNAVGTFVSVMVGGD